MALIYQTNVHQKSCRVLIVTYRLISINLDLSVGYDEMSDQVSTHVHKFEISMNLCCEVQKKEEKY